MKTDRIFVLLLVVMLPMSGCFDDAVGDAEGADDESSTTVVNNYYNNTTTIVPVLPTLVLYVPANTTANITTVNGEMVEILDVWSDPNADGYEDVYDTAYTVSSEFMCSTHTSMQTAIGVGQRATYPDGGTDWLPTDGTSCVYDFDRRGTSSQSAQNTLGDLYVIYRIH
ncbi:MAG: hypothetical protein ACJZ6A_03065 [Candidatus Poseidoniaceae archaeon]